MRRLFYGLLIVAATTAWAGADLPKALKDARVPVYPKAKLAESKQKVSPWISHLYRYEASAPAGKVKDYYIKEMKKKGWMFKQDMAKFKVGIEPRASEMGDLMLGTKLVSQPITHHLTFDRGKGTVKRSIISISKAKSQSKVTILLYVTQQPQM